MIKYVLFGKNLFQYTSFDNIRFMYSEVLDDDDIIYIPPDKTFGEKWIDFWTKKRLFRKWSSLFGIPFLKMAYKSYFKEGDKLSVEDDVIFLFLKNEPWFFGEKGFLDFLKDTFPKGKFVYKLLNLVEYIEDDIYSLKEYYDLVIACDPKDAHKYNLPLLDIGYSKVKLDNNKKPYCDCFYIGSCKNRFSPIYDVYKKLSDNGINALFYIVGVPENQIIPEKGIVYNKPLNYDEVVQFVEHTNVVMEIVQQDQETPTLRLLECIAYNKKLLTNNPMIINSKYYNQNCIQVFSTAENINLDFFKDESINEYPNSEMISVRYMLKSIKRELTN